VALTKMSASVMAFQGISVASGNDAFLIALHDLCESWAFSTIVLPPFTNGVM
jgi:hypothetical protein